MSTVGVQRLSLCNLHTKITNSLIVGVIIAKQPYRIFPDKKNEGERGVWNFTLRDSVTDYINVTCWGKAAYVMFLDKTFLVGDVVDVIDARIDIRHVDNQGERFRPAVTSPFNLTVSETQSQIIVHAGDNYSEFLRYLRIPSKPLAGCLTLADITNNGATIRGDMVDLLVAVKNIKPARKVQIKDGTEKEVREIEIMDQTAEMSISVWDEDMNRRIVNWKARETVLFLADMRVDWSNFHKMIVVSFNSRTIVTEDPIIPEADELRQIARNAPYNTADYLNQIALQIPDVNSLVCKIMSCKQVLDRAEIKNGNENEGSYFVAIVYGFVMQLDLDGFTKVVTTRCGRCNSLISEIGAFTGCMNLECPVGSGAEPPILTSYFDIKIIIADHSGSLANCRLCGKVAEKVLGLTVDQFQTMSFEQKGALKWNFLLKRCAIHVVTFKAQENFEPFTSILSCRVPKSEEIRNNLPFY